MRDAAFVLEDNPGFPAASVFLLPAISAAARTAPFPGRAPALAWRAVAASSRWLPESSTHGPGDSAPRSHVPSLTRRVATSTDRSQSLATGPPAAMPSPPGAAVPGPISVCDLPGQRRAELRSHPAAIPSTSGSHSGDSLSVHARSLPASSSRQQTNGRPASAAAPILGNPVVEIFVFACHHLSQWQPICHCIMRDSVRPLSAPRAYLGCSPIEELL